jgi:outer membrane protein TolC
VATTLASLFSWASRSWSGEAAISQTVGDFGRRRAALEGARAAYDGVVAGYRQTVLTAFQEVEDDLASLRYLAEEAVQQQVAVTAAQQSLSLELDRYRAGTDSYLNVITTQTILLGDQENAVVILQRRLNAAVDLVKALGGGWDASALPSGDELTHTSNGKRKT